MLLEGIGWLRLVGQSRSADGRWLCKIVRRIYRELICQEFCSWHTSRMTAASDASRCRCTESQRSKTLIVSRNELIVSRDSDIEQLKLPGRDAPSPTSRWIPKEEAGRYTSGQIHARMPAIGRCRQDSPEDHSLEATQPVFNTVTTGRHNRTLTVLLDFEHPGSPRRQNSWR
jgi:hypothetical protein